MPKKPQKRILIAIPSFDTKIHLETISSIISTRDYLLRNGVACGMIWLRDSLVTRARNKLVTEFLKQDYTHLFFIDTDIVFTPDDFLRVVVFDKPITAAPYPIKHEEEIEKGDASLGWCLNFPLGKYNFKDNVKGFKICDYAGTGFMCIQRNVFETIIKKYPQIEFKSDIQVKLDAQMQSIKTLGKKEYAFFDTGIQGEGILDDPQNTKRYLSEDYFFCQLWRQCGGVIWADLTSELRHIGIKTYERKPILKRHH